MSSMRKWTKIKCLYCCKEIEVPNWRIRKGAKYCSRTCHSRGTHGNQDLVRLWRDKDWLYKKYILEEKSARQIAKELGNLMFQPTISRWLKRYRIKTVKRRYVNGVNNPNYREWKRWIEDGYWTKSVNGKSVREHRLVMEEVLGRKLNPQEAVHHINGDKLDNRKENLMLFSNHSAHIAYEGKIGNFAKRVMWGDLSPELGKELRGLFSKFNEK